MKLWTSEHVYDHPWETVTAACWQKYPNSNLPQVIGAHVTDRQLNTQTGTLTTVRLMKCQQSLPSWMKKFVGVSCGFVREETIVNALQKSFVAKTRNLSFNNYLSMEETCTYSPDPKDANKTLFKQEYSVTAGPGLFGLAGSLESFVVSRATENAHKGRKAMEHVIERIKEETQNISILPVVACEASNTSTSTTTTTTTTTTASNSAPASSADLLVVNSR